MKKILFLLIAAMLVSCDKAFINGDLDGMWHLESVASPERTENPDTIFYSFQRHMVQLSRHYDIGLPDRLLGEFERHGNSITMHNFYTFPLEKQKATLEMLKEYHIQDYSVEFTIITLDEENLVMKNRERTYTLRKW